MVNKGYLTVDDRRIRVQYWIEWPIGQDPIYKMRYRQMSVCAGSQDDCAERMKKVLKQYIAQSEM